MLQQQRSYSDIVTAVNGVPVLAEHSENMSKKFGAMNLVTHKWLDTLNKSLVLQAHKEIKYPLFGTPYPPITTPNFYHTQKIPEKDFHVVVTVAGQWNCFPDKSIFTIHGNEPLLEIARILSADMIDYEVLQSQKFFIDLTCQLMICKQCGAAIKKFKVKSENDPCVLNTNFFDGKILSRAFQSMFVKTNRTVYGIMTIKLDTRTFWTANEENGSSKKVVRLGGTVLQYVVFDENALYPSDYEDDDIPLADNMAFCEEIVTKTPVEKASASGTTHPVGIGQKEWQEMIHGGSCFGNNSGDFENGKRKLDDELEECIPNKLTKTISEESPEDNEEIDFAVPHDLKKNLEKTSEFNVTFEKAQLL